MNASAVRRDHLHLPFLETIDVTFTTRTDGQCGSPARTPGRNVLDQLSSPSTSLHAGLGAMPGDWVGMHISPFTSERDVAPIWLKVFLHEFLSFDRADFNHNDYASGLDIMGLELRDSDRLHVQRLVAVGECNIRLHTDGTTTLAPTALPVHTGTMPAAIDTLAVAIPSTGNGSPPMYESGALIVIEPVVAFRDGDFTTTVHTCTGIVINFAHDDAYGKVVLDPNRSVASNPYGNHNGKRYLTRATVLQLRDSVTIGGVTITSTRRDSNDRIVVTINGAFDQPIPTNDIALNRAVVTRILTSTPTTPTDYRRPHPDPELN